MIQGAKVLSDLLDNAYKKYPHKIALEFENRTYSYSDLYQSSLRVSSYVSDHVKKQEVVAMFAANTSDFICQYFGALRGGNIVLLMPTNISDERMKYQFDKTNPKLFITDKKYENKIKRLQVRTPVVHPNTLNSYTITTKKKRALANDFSSIIFTSGTTSAPKGVALRHKHVVQATHNIAEYVGFTRNDTDINISQLSHSFGLGHVHCVFGVGGTVVLFRDAINIRKILETIPEKKVTTMGAVPANLRLMLKHYKKELRACDPYLKFVQTDTSLLEDELISGILKTLPTTDFHYYYGLSEASRSTFLTFNKHTKKTKSVGKALPKVRIKIVDKKNKSLPTGEIGEICIKGKHVIDQYWKNKKASKAIVEGWLNTGDAGYLDEDGFLYYVGRRDDVINVGGDKVSPEEIESVALKLHWVIDCAAVPMKDEVLGQAVRLYVVTKPNMYDKTKITKHIRSSLEPYKVPRDIQKIAKIPRTENGKIQRAKLI